MRRSLLLHVFDDNQKVIRNNTFEELLLEKQNPGGSAGEALPMDGLELP